MEEAPFFEPLTARDAWFLYAEPPEAPLDLGTVYVFEGCSRVHGGRGAEGLEETVAERIHLVRRHPQEGYLDRATGLTKPLIVRTIAGPGGARCWDRPDDPGVWGE